MSDLESQELLLIREAVQEGLELLREIQEELRGRKDDGK